MNHDTQRFEIEVLDAQQSDRAGSLPDQREGSLCDAPFYGQQSGALGSRLPAE